MNDAALGQFITLVFLPFVPTLGGAVIGIILSLFVTFMFTEVLTVKGTRHVSNSNPVRGSAEQ